MPDLSTPQPDPSNNPTAYTADHPFRVMVVCTGNICRSAMAEVVLRDRFDAAGLADQVVVDSTGVSSEESGNPIDRRAKTALHDHGYATDGGHRARQVQPSELLAQDLVLAMTSQHARALRRISGLGSGTDRALAVPDGVLRMYRSFDPAAPVVAPGEPEHVLDVDDPWYGGRHDFEECLVAIEAAADGIVDYVRTRVGAA